MNNTLYKPIKEDVRHLPIRLHGIKLMVDCLKCGKKWSLFFEDLEEIENRLPSNWYVCQDCSDKYYQNK